MRRPFQIDRGFAILDYMCGTVILVSALATVSSLNMAKFRTLSTARKRQSAIFAANSVLELHADHYSQAQNFPKIKASHSTETWTELELLAESQSYLNSMARQAELQIRARRVKAHDSLIELNVVVRWFHDRTTFSSLNFSTILSKPR